MQRKKKAHHAGIFSSDTNSVRPSGEKTPGWEKCHRKKGEWDDLSLWGSGATPGFRVTTDKIDDVSYPFYSSCVGDRTAEKQVGTMKFKVFLFKES